MTDQKKPSLKSRKSNPLASRIKKVMQADEDVGKIAQATPVLIGHSVELFLGQLCRGAAELATARGEKTLSAAHLKAYVEKEASMDFLKGIVASAPELADKTSSSAKRQRAPRDEDGGTGGRGGGRKGRGRGVADGSAAPRKRAKKAEQSGAGVAKQEDVKLEEVEGKPESASGPSLRGGQNSQAKQLPDGVGTKVEPVGHAAKDLAEHSKTEQAATADVAGTSTARGILQSPWEAEQPKASEEQTQLELPGKQLPVLPHSLAAAGPVLEEDDYDEE